jgi:hypothetical protein
MIGRIVSTRSNRLAPKLVRVKISANASPKRVAPVAVASPSISELEAAPHSPRPVKQASDQISGAKNRGRNSCTPKPAPPFNSNALTRMNSIG